MVDLEHPSGNLLFTNETGRVRGFRAGGTGKPSKLRPFACNMSCGFRLRTLTSPTSQSLRGSKFFRRPSVENRVARAWNGFDVRPSMTRAPACCVHDEGKWGGTFFPHPIYWLELRIWFLLTHMGVPGSLDTR